MGKSWTHNLAKIDYTNEDSLRKTLKRVFPNLDNDQLENRFKFESKYIGWKKEEDDMGIMVWHPPMI